MPALASLRPRGPRDLRVAAVVVAWVPLLLGADAATRHVPGAQSVLAVATWLLLAALLAGETALARLQVGVVVAYATLVEYTFSAGLGVYVYRAGGVPGFVPPGHGLLYLGALALGRSEWVRRRAAGIVRATAAAVTAYAAWGLSPLAPRLDVLGALWAACLLWFLARGRNPLVYAGAFVVVTWLELVGTGLGTWAWAPSSPTGLIAQGNPPSGAAGGYCFFDAAAMAVAPWRRRRLRRLRRPRRLTQPLRLTQRAGAAGWRVAPRRPSAPMPSPSAPAAAPRLAAPGAWAGSEGAREPAEGDDATAGAAGALRR